MPHHHHCINNKSQVYVSAIHLKIMHANSSISLSHCQVSILESNSFKKESYKQKAEKVKEPANAILKDSFLYFKLELAKCSSQGFVTLLAPFWCLHANCRGGRKPLQLRPRMRAFYALAPCPHKML